MSYQAPRDARILRKRAGIMLHELATAMRVDLNELHDIEIALLWPNEQIARHYKETLNALRKLKRKEEQ